MAPRWRWCCLDLEIAPCLQTPPGNYDESKVGTYTLPDPLVFNNGKPVRTAKEWNRRRRPEILELFAANVYGHSPQAPAELRYEVFDVDEHALAGKAVRKQVTIYFSSKKDGPKEDLLIYIPAGTAKPPPVILVINFAGNQAVSTDPAIKLRYHLESQSPRKAAGARGTSRAYQGLHDLEEILARGYAYCHGSVTEDIEPDFNGGYVYGIRPLFLKTGQTEPAVDDDWGAIGRRWPYGASRRSGLPGKGQRSRREAGAAIHGPLTAWQDSSLGRRCGSAFRDGDQQLFR